MTVKELIKELENMPQDRTIKIGTLSLDCGVAQRVIEYDDYVEIESNDD